MILTSQMKQLIAVVMEQDLDKLTRLLLEKGVLEFISIKEISSEIDSKVKSVESKIPLQDYRDVRRRVEYLLALSDFKPPDPRAEDMGDSGSGQSS
jgi:uncharacterized protein YeeX (DUF496 family)